MQIEYSVIIEINLAALIKKKLANMHTYTHISSSPILKYIDYNGHKTWQFNKKNPTSIFKLNNQVYGKFKKSFNLLKIKDIWKLGRMKRITFFGANYFL